MLHLLLRTACTAHLILDFIILTIFGKKYVLLIYGLMVVSGSGYLAVDGIMNELEGMLREA
jgi:hypothetical protein